MSRVVQYLWMPIAAKQWLFTTTRLPMENRSRALFFDWQHLESRNGGGAIRNR